MKEIRKIYIYIFIILFSLSANLNSYSQNSEKRVIRGTVIDSKTGTPLTGTSVFLAKTTVGTITDKDGKYIIETSVKADTILFSFIGYETESRKLLKGDSQIIDISLKLSAIALNEVVINRGKTSYKNKNNPSVNLIERVIANKDANREEKYNYLEYKKYEKLQFALSNITEKFKKGNLFGKFKFVFDNIDTTKRIAKNVLPIYIKEAISDHYYRKDPEAVKDIVRNEKTTNIDEYLDNKGISAHLDYLYQNINIYDNEILFLTNKFVSPIAKSAPVFYRYYIIDTLSVNDIKCIRLFFEPRNKSDYLFHGYLYITLDSSYAVRKIDMGLNKNINVDWVQDISITQDFEQFGNKNWLLAKDEISIDFGLAKNSMGLFGQRTITYKDYKIDEPIDNKVFRGPEKVERLEQSSSGAEFWESNRYVPLTKSESKIYSTIDSIKKIPAFQRKMKILLLITTDFLNLNKVELGPFDSFYSYNPVEGSRFRPGGRTTPEFSKKFNIDGYLAYGLNDKMLKYNLGLTYSLSPRTIYVFPVKSIRISYQKEVRIPGQELQLSEDDNILLSLKRGVNDKFFLNNTFKTEFLNEYENHFSFLAGFSYTRQSPYGNLHFNKEDYLSLTNEINYINISELSLNLRYAPNETFYQGKLYRYPVRNKYPVIQLKGTVGSKLIYGDYNYLRLQMSVSKRFYASILGYGDITFEAGKIMGKVPFPLLFIHRANQTYSYQKNSFSMMNFLEFVSDQYASVNIEYCFNGFILNKIPLVKKLKLRELITCKVLYGELSKTNNPGYQIDLFKFPTDKNATPLTYTLGRQPYIEAGIGVSNILKIFRVDLVKRFTYRNNPNVTGSGFLVQFRFDI
jgi:hypothetical protein